MSNNKCCCKCSKKNPCGDTIKIQKDNIYKQFRNCCKNQKCLKYDYYGFDLTTFKYMPNNVDKQKIMKSLEEIVRDNNKQHIKTEFKTANLKNINAPYMELLYYEPQSKLYYVYSTTLENNLFTYNSADIIINEQNVIINDKRKYMWDTAINSPSNIPTTKEFPLIKTFKYNNDYIGSELQMQLLTTVGVDVFVEQYEIKEIYRMNNYIWYPGSMAYCLVDGNTGNIYIMQTVSNMNTDLHINAYNAEIISDLIILKKNWKFLYFQVPNNETIVIVSTSLSPALLISDSLNNSYQFVNKEYNVFLYDNLLK